MGPNSTPKTTTPAKKPHGSKLKGREILKPGENSNPNLSNPTPAKPKPKPSSCNVTKSAKSKNFTPRRNINPIPDPVVFSPRNKIIQRKFVVVKKKNPSSTTAVDCKCGVKNPNVDGTKKCLCLAYDTLRASQEEFFKKPSDVVIDKRCEEGVLEPGESSVSPTKRRREKLLEEARKSVPESGKVLHLVQAFEKLLSLPKENKGEGEEEGEDGVNEGKKKTKVMKWALPGLQPPSCALFCSPELSLTEENLGLDRRASVSSSWDSSSGSASNKNSNGVRRSRRNSLESCGTTGGRRWKKKQLKPTSQKPFKLRTEERGRAKEEEFMNKVQEMMMEEERLRIPVAQGLPWTTDQPECLIKPEVKENTIPEDLKLHSDIRAVERAEFDHQVDVKMNLIEQYKMEREKQKTLAEEEEIRRLRKELVPKAQPMPYFDRPFIPTRSMKHPTIPREPKFNRVENKNRFSSSSFAWSDASSFSYGQL